MTHRSPREPLRVGLARLSESSAAMIGMAFERFGRHEFTIVEPDEAQVLVVDADRLVGADNLERLRALHPASPMVLLATRDAHHANCVTLRKPIGVQALLDALRGLRTTIAATPRPASPAPKAQEPAAPQPPRKPEEPHKAAAHERPDAGHGARGKTHPRTPRADMQEACCGDAPDIPASHLCTAPDLARAYFDDEAGLLGTMRAAVRHGMEQRKALTVTGLPHALYVDAAQPCAVITDLGDEVLRGVSAGASALQYYTIAAVPQAARGWRRIELEGFMWRLALWSSRGRLPKGVGLDARVRLKAWPNFTRLPLTPHALRIAALWVTRHLSPLEVAAALRVPQRYVFALYSAAKVAGLIEPAPTAADSGLPAPAGAGPAAAGGALRGLLKRILGKLVHAR